MSVAKAKLKVGDRVKLLRTGLTEVEVGVVVAVWYDDVLATYDTYVAFFGSKFPEGEPEEKPYILRYTESSLKRVESKPKKSARSGRLSRRAEAVVDPYVIGILKRDEADE